MSQGGGGNGSALRNAFHRDSGAHPLGPLAMPTQKLFPSKV